MINALASTTVYYVAEFVFSILTGIIFYFILYWAFNCAIDRKIESHTRTKNDLYYRNKYGEKVDMLSGEEEDF